MTGMPIIDETVLPRWRTVAGPAPERGLSGGPLRHDQTTPFELARQAMAAGASGQGADVLAPLAAHAMLRPVGLGATAAVMGLLRGSERPLRFDTIVAALGSRVAARFAVLELIGRGAVGVLTPGFLSDTSLLHIDGESVRQGGGWH